MSEFNNLKLRNIGVMTGMGFDNGGYAMVSLNTTADLSRLLDAYRQYEEHRANPNQDVLNACSLLLKKIVKTKFRIMIDVPIAQEKVKFTPVHQAYSGLDANTSD